MSQGTVHTSQLVRPMDASHDAVIDEVQGLFSRSHWRGSLFMSPLTISLNEDPDTPRGDLDRSVRRDLFHPHPRGAGESAPGGT